MLPVIRPPGHRHRDQFCAQAPGPGPNFTVKLKTYTQLGKLEMKPECGGRNDNGFRLAGAGGLRAWAWGPGHWHGSSLLLDAFQV